MQLFGVVNASPDSLNADSVVTDAASALARARRLLAEGADAIDLGGQGSTDIAAEVDPALEWSRLEAIVPALAGLGVALSIDTWRPEVARLALSHGASWLNAADGLQAPGMCEVAAEFACPVVLPFLSGPDPRRMTHVEGDPVEVLVDWFEQALARCEPYGIRSRLVLDPGTGFAPPNWDWSLRYLYQKRVYSNLDQLRRFGLPLYIALPWKDTAQHDELLDIVLAQRPEYGRAHYPAKILAAAARLGL